MNISFRLKALCAAAAFFMSAQAGAIPVVFNSTPVAICDLCTVTSVLDVNAHGQLTDVNALVDITHSYDADIRISLSHAGTTVILANRQGGSGGANYTGTLFDDQAAVSIAAGYAYAPYAGAFRPEQQLASFLGSDVFGLWTLSVTDFEAGDDGTINRFGIAASVLDAAQVPEPGSLALLGAGLLGFVGVSRKTGKRA
jgi:subtilisin-like proprotein convertase family protein